MNFRRGPPKGLKRVHSLTKAGLVADKCFMAERYFHRLLGLIGKTSLEPGEAMWFPRCREIHMWFMSIPIDVVFLRARREQMGRTVYVVSSVHEDVRPWRFLPLRDRRASETLEMRAGSVGELGITVGDELCID